MAARQRKHPEAAGWMNDAIYAANDGLGSIFGIVAGVAGATSGNSHFILVSGLAGMIGSALITGTGAYLTAKSEHELFEAGLARERSAVDYDEAEAHEVLALNFQIRGLPEEVAISLVHLLAENKERFINALARAQSNFSEETLSTPSVAALVGAVATATGAFIPIIPFFFMTGIPAMIVAAVISLLAHFVVGAARSSMTVRAWWSTGLELTAFGAVVGTLTSALVWLWDRSSCKDDGLGFFYRSRSSDNRDHVLLRDGLDSRLGERRKVCCLDCPHALSDFGMVRLQVSHQEFDRTAFGGPWPISTISLGLLLLSYMGLTQTIKFWLLKRSWI
jgi:VIT1/CCC1 family predicted Fe2+/Mn2+ transporter